MKKKVIVFAVLTFFVLFCPCIIPYSKAQQPATPPLLMQPAAVVPPAPSLPGTPFPPPAGLPGTAQIIPLKTLLSNLSASVVTVQKLTHQLVPGKVWTMRAPAGEIEVKAGILYQGSVVAVLHFNPQDGTVLPLGMHPRIYQIQTSNTIQMIKSQLPSIVSKLKILPTAEFREPEASWVFPVALGNTIVAHLKVYYDGVHIVPDYPANQEMAYYGQ